MCPIHVARLGKSRPVLVLTRELVRTRMNTVTVAPLTTTNRSPATELLLGAANSRSPARSTDRLLLDDHEARLTDAIHAAFDLD